MWAETDITNTTEQTAGLLEQILTRDNLNRAYKQVKRNKGAGGIDGMQVDELLPYLKRNQKELVQSLRDGKYRPQPVRRVKIPKENGKTRKLGIPTVVDRLIQQAICQVLTPIFEKQFSDNSFGFRPKRSAHDALKRCQTNITEGYKEKKLFLKVNREKTQTAHVNKVKYQIIRGWMNYFKLADAKNLIRRLDEWTRSRIRMVTWKRWKRVRTRFENLKRLGSKEEQAWMWANTRKGYWHIAHSPILSKSLSNERFKRAGYLSLMECYSAK